MTGYRDFLGSGRALGRLSDTLCLENGLSVVRQPKQKSQGKYKNYGEWAKGWERPLTFQQKLCAAIDAALEKQPSDLAALCQITGNQRDTPHRSRKSWQKGFLSALGAFHTLLAGRGRWGACRRSAPPLTDIPPPIVDACAYAFVLDKSSQTTGRNFPAICGYLSKNFSYPRYTATAPSKSAPSREAEYLDVALNHPRFSIAMTTSSGVLAPLSQSMTLGVAEPVTVIFLPPQPVPVGRLLRFCIALWENKSGRLLLS